jgi:transcription elongation factor GreA
MTYNAIPSAAGTSSGPLLTREEYDALVEELESRRATYRATLAASMRHARAFGSLGHEDDRLAALEDAAVDRSRIAVLERILGSATVVEGTVAEDAIGLGSIVRVRCDDGREVEYEIVGRRTGDTHRAEVTPGSPVGSALLGARRGETVRIVLPSGGTRELEVLAVEPGR